MIGHCEALGTLSALGPWLEGLLLLLDSMDHVEAVVDADDDDDAGVTRAGPGGQRLSPSPLVCESNLELPPSK